MVKKMITYQKYDNATGGSDNSTDTNPSVNPNSYLPWRADNWLGSAIIIIAIYIFVVYLIVHVFKQKNYGN